MILTIAHLWIAGLWLAFLVIWTVAAVFAKRSRDPQVLRRGVGVRALLGLMIFGLYILVRRSPVVLELQLAEFHSVPMAVAGATIVTAGAILAFSARAAIGRNWATPAARKADTGLVTSGPYALVRHPIYGGILLMMIGTAIGLIPMWWAVALAAGTYFIVSARSEERYMTERFPDRYPAYRARTKMLLPFIM